MRVLVFGDSITYGAWDSQGGWADRLKQHFHKQYIESNGTKRVQVLNLGIGSDSSTKILKRLQPEIEARHSKSWPFVFVFSFGTNDERSINGQVEASLEQFKANVQSIIDLAGQHTDKILFCGKPPISQSTIVFKGQEYSNQRIMDYDAATRKIVEAERIPFVEVFSEFAKQNQNLFAVDGMHLNDAGHELIASLVQPELEKFLA